MQPLNPLRLPLQGQILIEASAGTGKTYTIALLFLRLLLERKLSVDNILVVTFTKAATEELRGRIRQRIRETLDALDFPVGTKQPDPLLQTVIANISNRDEARILLSDALVRMDETAISTIHGFCQRMLQDYAFESAAPFELNFIESETLLRQRIIEDFWRQNFYTENKDQIARVLSNWRSPSDLLSSLGGHLGESNVRCLPEVDEAGCRQNFNDLTAAYEAIEQQWPICREGVIEQLWENKRLKRDNKKSYGHTRLPVAIEAMESLIHSASKEGYLAPEIELFTRSKIESSLKGADKIPPPDHLFFDLFEGFYRHYQNVADDQKFQMIHAARHYLAEQLSERKRALSQIYFDDLLSGMDAALQGSKGATFATRIRNRFPLILVDEFQDTDPLQYRIFSTIHHAVASQVASVAGLFLIGDPKQAIYAFRGADIFTYMQARDDTPQKNHFTMENNYRSTPAMVEAVNQLFDQARSFLFENISFPRVRAAGNIQTQPLLIDGKPAAAMHCMLLPSEEKSKALDKGKARQFAAQFCANEIAQLLSSGQHGVALIGPEAISAGDVAVLVRSHAEANLVREALARYNITSVYYSQESVFASDEATQLCLVLESLHDHRNEANIRSALASPLFGYTAIQLDGLLKDEHQWENTLVMLAQYRKLVREKSFALLFQTLLVEHDLVKRLNGAQNGERSLTNFLHLAELIQLNAPNTGGLQGVLRWLKEQIQAPEKFAENQQLRLESDEDLVKIATIHASKGLEYSVVFLPFLWSARACRQHEPLCFHTQHTPPQLTIDLGTGLPENYLRAEKERLAEDLRLLYVAITRARHRCCFCWGKIKEIEQSALYYLLHQRPPSDQQALLLDLSRLDNDHGKIQISEFPTILAKPIQPASSASNSLEVMPFRGIIDKSWKITSYSGLIASHNRYIEQPDYDSIVDMSPQTTASNAFGFPRGAEAGICLHTIFENISFNNTASHKTVVEEQLARAAYAEHWVPIVLSWLTAILHTELKPGLKLANLNATARIDEMAFFFPLKSVRQQRLNRILQAHGYAPLLNHQQRLNGLMSGFIDLVFEDQGQYYVADYKSNYLGDRADDYLPDKLETVMQQHRYDLQYLIYSLALHRYLAGRIANYRYDQHFGGIYYLFLRGMNPKYVPKNGVYFMHPDFELIDQLDRLFADRSMTDA